MVQIMAHSARTFLDTAQQKLAAACLFDLSEHRLYHLLSQSVRRRSRRRRSAHQLRHVHQLFLFAAVGCWARPGAT